MESPRPRPAWAQRRSQAPSDDRWGVIRGCDLWTFRDGLVVKKASYWKIRTTS